ncbi:MAG: glucan 1,4-alpha-glucosidase, partial [Mesorhizobium sp.]
FNNKIRAIPAGKMLRVELVAKGVVHWSSDKWLTVRDDRTAENAFGVHLVDLPVDRLPQGSTIVFTFFWPDNGGWENVDFTVGVDAQS